MTAQPAITDIFKALDAHALLLAAQGMPVSSPADGKVIAYLTMDSPESLEEKISAARMAQKRFAALTRQARVQVVEAYAAALKSHLPELAAVIHLEAGKTIKEATGEATASADVLMKTIKDTMLPDLGNMQRIKERPPAGLVGLITSFNFPMAVAHWTAGAAWLAGNGVVWKPSEKTPLSALACKAVWYKAVPEYTDLMQVVIGQREVGEMLVGHEEIDIISATGSVGMGKGIKATLAGKKNNVLAPILELGGNNGVIISQHISEEHLEWAVKALLGSYLGTTGQRCTNTRRVIVHRSRYDQLIALFRKHIERFMQTSFKDGAFDPANEYGYGPLIDEDAFQRFEAAKKQAAAEGGQVLFGARLSSGEQPEAYYVEPAVAQMPAQIGIMHQETFAPILFVAPYEQGIGEALALLNAPDNAGLVGAIYTQSQQEADQFAAQCEAGHVLINPPKGTGTPAHGMGFGGNKDSGCGEILNSADPLQPFTRPGRFTRIAQNKDIVMDA